ncbi:E6 [Human papillomavirus type 195]|uniref:Protein E6 n=1 Tax=Betapapillomavirus 1 TaxID=337051 RepID=A0A2D2AKX0_9PAPI|nr:E6 [Human papillomavirus type 195]ATQ38098.1 E6 [Betapapillomavirus 1]
METYPMSIADLARLLDIPVVDLLVPCNFCFNFLTYFELCDFDNKLLTLIWKDDKVFGCCRRCSIASGFFEFQQFYQGSVIGRDIEAVEQKSIFDICVRCHHCLRLLDSIEKLDICGRQQPFHKVRDNWKGLCKFCK